MKRAVALAGLVVLSAGAARASSQGAARATASAHAHGPATAHAPVMASAASHGPPTPHPPSPLPPLPPPHVVRAAPPLPMLPSIARVRVEAGRDRMIVVEDLQLPRGDWQAGGIDVYVAFGAPGVPIALDAHLLPAPPGHDLGVDEEADRLSTEPSVRRDAASAVLLGPPQMAGVVVRVRESQLRRVFATTDEALVRVRSLLRPPGVDGTGARDVVVRLGVAEGRPLTLGRVEVASLEPQEPVVHAEAALCGADADPWPLAVAVEAPRRVPPASQAVAPADAVRHADDDLCIRWWVAR